jgi:hypothetical protein
MFEDFKEKIREHDQKSSTSPETTVLSPQVTEKLKEKGITVENFTLKDLFPEVLDKGGTTDLSLMSGAEFEVMVTYATLRKYLIEKYPQSQQEATMLGQVWDEEPEEPLQINVTKAREDPKAKFFFKTLLQMKAIYDKVDVLQAQASEYEKICLRFYWHLTYNWSRAPNLQLFRETFRNQEIFEIVEAYFKICKKYHQPTFEEPYYFLEGERRREVKLEGDMLKRTTDYSDNEIRISILEGIP